MTKKILVMFLLLALAAGLEACADIANYDPYAIPATATVSKYQIVTLNASSTPTPQPRTCEVIAAQALNLRAGAGVNNSVIAWLVPGDILTLTNTQPRGAWIEVVFADRTGWVNSNYCKGK